MLVKNWMSTKVVTIDAKGSMQEAINLMKKNDIRLLPVLSKERLVGVITDRDLKRASASDATTLDVHELLYLVSKILVRDIMTRDPVTVTPDLTVEETAELLLEKKISGVPVVDAAGRIAGVITQTDLFRVLISLTGVKSRGIQFAFKLADRPGSIKDVADIIRKFGGRMVSILTSYENVEKGFRKVYIRMHSVDPHRLEELKAALRQQGELLYMVDPKENRREIFVP